MGRAGRVFAAALLVSLLIHLALMAQAGRWWDLPAEEVPFPISAHLVLPQPKAPVAPLPDGAARPPAPASQPVSDAASPADPSPPPPLIPPMEPAATLEPPPQGAAEERAASGAGAASRQESPPAPAPAASPPAATPPRIVRALPEHMVLTYTVQSGDEGFGLGKATYTWRAEAGRYRLESVAEATGLASLFVSGRIVQTSEGRIGPAGLVPEQFTQTRGNKAQEQVRFDWETRQLLLPKGAEVLRDQTQDLLSFSFHLAMTFSEQDESWILPVTNGRKLKGYRFALLGRENVELGAVTVEAWHVQGTRAFEGSMDVWLAPSHHGLPVRIRTEDQKGKVMLLTLARTEG